MIAAGTSRMVFYDTPYLPPLHDIDAHVKMTPKVAQMALPVFAPKKRHKRQMSAAGTSRMVVYDPPCVPLHIEIDAHADLTRN